MRMAVSRSSAAEKHYAKAHLAILTGLGDSGRRFGTDQGDPRIFLVSKQFVRMLRVDQVIKACPRLASRRNELPDVKTAIVRCRFGSESFHGHTHRSSSQTGQSVGFMVY